MPVIATPLNCDPEGRQANAFRLQVGEKNSFRWSIGFNIRSFGKISIARLVSPKTTPIHIIHEGIESVIAGAHTLEKGILNFVFWPPR